MRLIIVRHGETDRNKSDYDSGPIDIPMNATGHEQVAATADRLRQERIDVIYSSDLLRAKQTTTAIAKHHPHTPIVFDASLRERNAGIFAGRPLAERKDVEQKSGMLFRDWKPEGGESLREVKERARKWFAEHVVTDVAKTVVVVSHGLFLSLLMEWAIEDGADVEKVEYRHHNAAITILDIPPAGDVKIIHLNDTSHLR